MTSFILQEIIKQFELDNKHDLLITAVIPDKFNLKIQVKHVGTVNHVDYYHGERLIYRQVELDINKLGLNFTVDNLEEISSDDFNLPEQSVTNRSNPVSNIVQVDYYLDEQLEYTCLARRVDNLDKLKIILQDLLELQDNNLQVNIDKI